MLTLVNELASSLVGENDLGSGRFFGLVVRTTSYATVTLTSLISTASICALDTYKCGARRRKRSIIAPQ